MMHVAQRSQRLSPPAPPPAFRPSLDSEGSVSYLLARWNEGDRRAAERLMPLVYDELRRMAHRAFRSERRDHTLQPTALVHEVVLELLDCGVRWQSQAHFYGLVACMMRRALVDHGRERAYRKRGGGLKRVPLEEAEGLVDQDTQELEALDDALSDLARLDPDKALIVELRFFGGLTVEQTADCLGTSPRTVAREWRRARALLYSQLQGEVRDAF